MSKIISIPQVSNEPPLYGTTSYIQIVNIGCGAARHIHAMGTEYYCSHGYTWSCTKCPVVSQTSARPVPKKPSLRLVG